MVPERRKKWIKAALILLAVFFCLNFAKNFLVKTVIVSSLSRAAHVPVSIGSADLNLLAGSIRLKNLRFRNPAGYPEKWMAEITEVFLDLDPVSLWKGRIHVEEARIFILSFSVIKNREGALNIQALKSASGRPMPERQAGATEARQPVLKIDKLYLSLGKVFYKDYAGRPGGPPAVQEFNLGIQNREYRDIDNPSAVVSLVVVEVLTRTTISRLADADLSFFKESAKNALKQGTGGLGDTAESLFNLFK